MLGWHGSLTRAAPSADSRHTNLMSPESLSHALEGFLMEARHALILEDGAQLFDLERARYSISTDHGKCLLHLWSAERNTVRRVLEAETKNDVLRLSVLRFGKSKPSTMEICRTRDRRTPTAKKSARSAYQRLLGRVLERQFAGYQVERLSTAMDLERSFGPIYTRGLLRKGNSAMAVLGINSQELQASVDAALTFGIVWLDACRSASARAHVGALALFVPPGTSAVVRQRLAHLDRGRARWQLFEFDERAQELHEVDCSDSGNIATSLVQCPNQAAAQERFAKSIATVQELLPACEVTVLSAGEVALRLCGLEFARARMATTDSFSRAEEIVFGVAASETMLTGENAACLAELTRRLAASRQAHGRRDDPLWRWAPERWLESLVVRDVTAIENSLDPACVYSQVPAFSASDRAMIDVLAANRQGRLAVIELKADEDIHLPLQGLDYWARVVWHHQRGEFQKFCYFPGRQLSPQAPLLLLVAPALHIHPATDTLLRYFSPEIDWPLAALDEHWRERVRVVFRKRKAEI